MRRGEPAGLRWDDVDLEHGRLRLRNSRVKGDGDVTEQGLNLKGKRGRQITVDPVTAAALRAHRKAQLEERMAWGGAWQDSGRVFVHEDGSPFHPDSITKMLKNRCKVAGLPWIGVHGLRHTWASLALEAGVHPKVVQERLGHSSIAVTLDIYSHTTPGMDEDAAALVAAPQPGACRAGPIPSGPPPRHR